MIYAYIQIIFMLVVAFLLGMFVAWQYWRKKYSALHDVSLREKERANQSEKELKEKVKGLTAQAAEEHRKRKELDEENKELESKMKEQDHSLKEAEDKIANLRKEVEVLDGELIAAHDEWYADTKQPPRKSSYYKYIDGKRYKASTLNAAEEAVSGRGDGRISKEDARKIFDTVSDGKQYTAVEKATIKYIRDHYKWTEEADHLFRHLVGSWAARDHDPNKIN